MKYQTARPSLIGVAALFAGLALAACSEDTSPLAPGAGPVAPEAITPSVTDGPAMPGHSHLIRLGLQEWIVSTQDPEAEVFTIYGNPEEIFNCGGGGGPEYSVQFNEFETAAGRMRNLLAQGDEINIYVYDFFGPEDLMGRTFCQYFAEEWKYRGVVHTIETFHRNLIENNSAWQWTTNGTVYDTDGAPYSYHEIQKFRRASNGNAAGWLKESITVTPKGGPGATATIPLMFAGGPSQQIPVAFVTEFREFEFIGTSSHGTSGRSRSHFCLVFSVQEGDLAGTVKNCFYASDPSEQTASNGKNGWFTTTSPDYALYEVCMASTGWCGTFDGLVTAGKVYPQPRGVEFINGVALGGGDFQGMKLQGTVFECEDSVGNRGCFEGTLLVPGGS
jgi:hypothetical protein